MKYKLTVNANQEDLFEVFKENFLNEYFLEKGKMLPESKLKPGFTFKKNVARDKRKAQERLATVKILGWEKPCLYRVSYESDRYRKITGVEIHELSEKKCEVILEEVTDKLVEDDDGDITVVNEVPESEEIRKASLWKKFQYHYLANSISMRKKAQAKETRKQEKHKKEEELA